MIRTVYSVWLPDENGDIFKGYKPTFVSSHLSLNAAKIICDQKNVTYNMIEETQENCHEDYIRQMEEADIKIIEDVFRIRAAARSMLRDGG